MVTKKEIFNGQLLFKIRKNKKTERVSSENNWHSALFVQRITIMMCVTHRLKKYSCNLQNLSGLIIVKNIKAFQIKF